MLIQAYHPWRIHITKYFLLCRNAAIMSPWFFQFLYVIQLLFFFCFYSANKKKNDSKIIKTFLLVFVYESFKMFIDLLHLLLLSSEKLILSLLSKLCLKLKMKLTPYLKLSLQNRGRIQARLRMNFWFAYRIASGGPSNITTRSANNNCYKYDSYEKF